MPQPDPAPTAAAGPHAGKPAATEATTPTPPDPVSDLRSDDDRDVGWGDELDDRSGGRDARWYEEQRPPHWE